MGARVAIVGSISYPMLDLIAAYVATLPADAVMICCAAPGVVTFAEETAKARGFEALVFTPIGSGSAPEPGCKGRRAGAAAAAQVPGGASSRQEDPAVPRRALQTSAPFAVLRGSS